MDQVDERSFRTCSFCAQSLADVWDLFASADGVSICGECVTFFDEGLQPQRELETEETSTPEPLVVPLIGR